MVSSTNYPLVDQQFAIENGPVEIERIYPSNMGFFSLANCKRLLEGKPPFSYGFPMVFLWLYHYNQ